ncbi:MAG: phosphate ABC transporter permease subunit PstC [Drouetiella hepatica Uher 2000/2452]|jgi:phosphate transport system permease protein|uniref:Phosphate transport system permease protein n=1 Tax=Drouetiella hepatica Uher 2000/2452 TaxID=904376 RepID=A0A951UM35_9CYAN|nr:phosphate ABC transporter permease subunit PstC [Drouetiella hepatica Uher 2000/2452]
MTSLTTAPAETLIDSSTKFQPERQINQIFRWLTIALAVCVGLVLLWITYSLLLIALPAIRTFGLGFLTNSTWNPVEEIYGVFPQIYGTILSSFLALLFAVPLGVGVAVFLTENFLPPKILTPIAFIMELLAAIPSVVYGLWGIFVFLPAIRPILQGINRAFGWIPFFSTTPGGRHLFGASLVLAIMILPTIVAISRDTMSSLPPQLRQGSYGLGATRWETITRVLVPAGLSGIIGSVMLALGRALGETMALAMLVGNANNANISWFSPASTIASLIANQFGEASGLQKSSLFYGALILMVLTLLVNILAQMVVSRFQQVE